MRSAALTLVTRLGRKFPRGTFVLTAFTGVSVLLGYVREGVIAYYFGTGSGVDAFLVAFSIPKLLIALATSTTVLALLPTYLGHVRAGETEKARELAQRGLSLLGAVLATLGLLLALFPVPAMTLLAPGFDPVRTAQAAQLLRGLLPYTILASAAAIYKMVLDSHQRFTAPAAARALVTILVIATVTLTATRLGIWALVVGYGAGGVLMFVMHAVGTQGLDTRPRLSALARPVLTGIPLAGVGWVALQLVLGQVPSVVDRMFASGLEPGSIAALNYALALTTAPQNFVTSVLATALFPVLAKKVADGRAKDAFREAVKWVGVVWVVTAPLIVVIIVFRVEIVSLLLERGAFDRGSTLLVASILAVAPFLIAISGSNAILNRLLLARQNYRFTAGLATFNVVAKVALNAILITSMGIVGLALASVVSGALALGLRFAYLRRYGAVTAGARASGPTNDGPD